MRYMLRHSLQAAPPAANASVTFSLSQERLGQNHIGQIKIRTIILHFPLEFGIVRIFHAASALLKRSIPLYDRFQFCPRLLSFGFLQAFHQFPRNVIGDGNASEILQ